MRENDKIGEDLNGMIDTFLDKQVSPGEKPIILLLMRMRDLTENVDKIRVQQNGFDVRLKNIENKLTKIQNTTIVGFLLKNKKVVVVIAAIASAMIKLIFKGGN